MGAICSGKTSAAVDSHAKDQSDSGVQEYAHHHPVPVRRLCNTDTRQGVGYTSTSETSLQKSSVLPGDITDLNDSTTAVKPCNTDTNQGVGNISTGETSLQNSSVLPGDITDLDDSTTAVKPCNTDTNQGVGNISTGETSLQKSSVLPGDITDLNDSTTAVKPCNTDTNQGVGNISTGETSLQKSSVLQRDITDNKMPARLKETTMDPNVMEIKSSNPHLQTTFEKMEKAGQLLETEIKNENSVPDFETIHKALKKDISAIFDKFTGPADRESIGQFMAKSGLVDTLVSWYKFVMEDMYEAFTLDTLKDDNYEISMLKEIRKILWNFSDQSPDFQIAIAKPRLMFGFLAKDLQGMRKEEFDQVKENSFPFTSAVNIIHNCSRNANVTKDMYTVEPKPGEMEAVSLQACLNPFLKSSDTYVKLITLLSLAHIMDEKENKKLLGTDESLFDFLLDMIQKATLSENRRHQGFSVEELLDGLSRLAKNDTNKGTIMKVPNAYEMIKGIIERGNVSETIAAVRTIWELIFDADNRSKVKEDTAFVKRLQDMKQSGTAELAEVASFACFVIEDSDDTADAYSEKGDISQNVADSMDSKKKKKETKNKLFNERTTGVPEEKPGHIMLSYNWSHKPLLLKVYKKLRSVGFPVWMDVYNMKGNLLDAMARAVKEAKVVIMCVSEQYGNSANCRTEAEFARKKKKIVIPFMMQKKPDTWLPDWLDMMLGEKLYYRFYDIELNDEPLFEERMKEVINVIADHMTPGKPGQPLPLPPPPVPETKPSAPTTTLKQTTRTSETSPSASKPTQSKQPTETYGSKLDSWTEDDIETWLRDNRLHTYAGMKAITCEQLQFLVKISVRAPEFFYRSLKEEVGLKGLEQLMRVSNAIEKLV